MAAKYFLRLWFPTPFACWLLRRKVCHKPEGRFGRYLHEVQLFDAKRLCTQRQEQASPTCSSRGHQHLLNVHIDSILVEMRTSITTLRECHGCPKRLCKWSCWRELPCGFLENTPLCHSPKRKVVGTGRGRTEDTLHMRRTTIATQRSSNGHLYIKNTGQHWTTKSKTSTFKKKSTIQRSNLLPWNPFLATRLGGRASSRRVDRSKQVAPAVESI